MALTSVSDPGAAVATLERNTGTPCSTRMPWLLPRGLGAPLRWDGKRPGSGKCGEPVVLLAAGCCGWRARQAAGAARTARQRIARVTPAPPRARRSSRGRPAMPRVSAAVRVRASAAAAAAGPPCRARGRLPQRTEPSPRRCRLAALQGRPRPGAASPPPKRAARRRRSKGGTVPLADSPGLGASWRRWRAGRERDAASSGCAQRRGREAGLTRAPCAWSRAATGCPFRPRSASCSPWLQPTRTVDA